MMAELTSTEIKEQTKKIQEVVEKARREHKAEHFTAVTPAEIEKKLTRPTS